MMVMPGRDKTGPQGQNSIFGNNPVVGSGKRQGEGPYGECVCPECGTKIAHQAGVPCTSQLCPKCNTIMLRE